MPTRSGKATWTGTLKEGKGQLESQSGAVKGAYSFPSRFEDAGGTNPEELIAASHAGCYAMAFSALLGEEGYTAGQLDAEAKVTLEEVDGKPTISKIRLSVAGSADGIDEATFKRVAEDAKGFCPVSRALAGTEISLETKFTG